MICKTDRHYSGTNNNMNTILSVILLLISGVNSLYLQCPKSNGKFPVENSDCKSYYECKNWKVISEKTCSHGENFNPSLQRCDYEELYYCAEKEIEKYKICKKSSGKFPKKNSLCQGYYVCEKWKVTGEFTCPRGQNFNPEQQWCDWEELYPCLEDKPSKKCPKPNGFFPKLGSQCKSYYQCIKGKAYELQCPDDLVFDSVYSQCEWPELYSCDEMKESTTVETSRVPYTTIQPTSSAQETSFRTESKETTKPSTEYFTTTSTERTESTAETRTSVTTDSVPTEEVSQSTKTEHTTRTSTTDAGSKSTEAKVTEKRTLSSTEGASSTKTKGTSEDYTIMSTQEISLYTQTEDTVQTNSPSTAKTKIVTDTFSTASILTGSPVDLVCPGANGLFPHPTDETKFLSCLEFIPTVMDCPDDLIYDQARKACTWRR